MKQEEIKYVYQIESSLDLDVVLDSLEKELNLSEGIIKHFSLLEDDIVEEKLSFEKLKKKALEVTSDEEYPSIILSNVEVNVDEDMIEIVSKIELELEGIEVDSTAKRL